ncbi:hypothetical protein N9F42_04535, partial [Pseudomonadales bacterium]|nr:hypothetical protein [Pseudomonadales bacterium]
HMLKNDLIFGVLARIIIIFYIVFFALNVIVNVVPSLKSNWVFSKGIDDLTWDFKLSDNAEELEVIGGIKPGIARELRGYINTHPTIKYLHLNLDRGGFVNEAGALGAIIKDKGLSTIVSSECVSACTIVFLAGKERILKKYARLGFHSHSYPNLTNNSHFVESSKKIYINLGVDSDFVDRIFSTSPSDMWYPSAELLVNVGIVTAVLGDNDLALIETKVDPLATHLRGLENSITDIFNETDPEKMLAKINLHHKNTHQLNMLSGLAVSDLSKRFVEINNEQIELSELSVITITKMFSAVEKLQDINLDDADQTLLETKYLKEICFFASENIRFLESIVNILDEKISLASTPIVLQELFFNEMRVVDLMISVKKNQKGILDSERESFDELNCSYFM